MRNCILLWGWQALALLPVSAEQIRYNTETNRRVLTAGLETKAGCYIENQPQLGGLKFGKGYDFAYGGCSVIAVYNTFLSLGERVSGERLCGIAEELQRRGAAWGGKYGVAPLALKRYMERYAAEKGLTVRSTMSAKAEVLDALGNESDAILAVVWNGSRLRDQLHAVHIEKREGGYIIHNTCYLKETSDGIRQYAERGAYGRLSEAIAACSSKKAVPALVVGIQKRESLRESS